MNPMHDAIMKRKGHGMGLDVTVLVGGKPILHAEKKEGSDLAPSGQPEGKEHETAESPEFEAGEKEGMDPGEMGEHMDSMDKEMTAPMADHEKENLMSKPTGKLSLGERAKMAALHRMKK